MNNRIFFSILAIFFVLVDVGISGKFESMRFVFLFFAFLFVLSTRYKIETIFLPALTYSFLYDISTKSQIPYASIFVLFVIFSSYFLRLKIADFSNQAVVFLVYMVVNFIICACSILLSSEFVSAYEFFKFSLISLLIYACLFPFYRFVINKFNNFLINEEATS